MLFQEAVHLVARLNAEQFARLKHRQLSGSDTFGGERLKGEASQILRVRRKVPGKFFRCVEMDIYG